MATLKTNTLTGTSTAGSIAVTGEGNSTTTNLQQGLAKAWVFGGTDASLTDNFNIASGTDNGTGDYSYAITNDMAITKHDNEGRVITLEFKNYYLVTVYTPNSKRDLRSSFFLYKLL